MTGTVRRLAARLRLSSPFARMSNGMLTIRRAEPLEDYWVRMVLSDGSTIERNVLDLLHEIPIPDRLKILGKLRDHAKALRQKPLEKRLGKYIQTLADGEAIEPGHVRN